MTDSPSPLLRYGVSLVTVLAAQSLNLLLWPLVEGTPSSLFFAAVIVSAWFGGLGPGLLATILSAAFLDYFFITPVHSLSLDLSAILRLSVFLLVALLTSYLTAARKRAEQALRIEHGQLEKRVEERTLELADTNESLRAEILERKRAENELWGLQREMGRVERLAALGRITGTIAHELGTPLNSVLGYTQLLAQEELSDGARRRLAIITTQVQRMGDIIQHYLSRTRGSSRKDDVYINELVQETLVLLNPIFQQHGVQVTTTLGDSLPLLRSDEASLQRVLINVLDNAVDATEQEGLLKIATRTSESSETKSPGIIIEITDTGAGISPELLPKIFDLFVTTKPSGKGTGLGLVVCQEIVKAHGGNIDITSRVGEGTCVRIFLPTGERFGESAVAEGAK